MVYLTALLLVSLTLRPVAGWMPPAIDRRAALLACAGTLVVAVAGSTCPLEAQASTTDESKPKFQRYPQIRFIAALGDPQASSGTGADRWGLWRDDPGPRGVSLRNYETSIRSRDDRAPAGWTFRKDDWWLEEHGLIMSNPETLPRRSVDRDFKRYVVTGDRQVTTALTVFEDGRWELAQGTLYDVTHLPCRSARYTPSSEASSCTPTSANGGDFPVRPGAEMPPVAGCAKRDYAVLFVLGEEV